MTPEMNDSQKVSPKIGLVAFFDILGFSKMMLANPLKESLDIINEKMLKVLNKAEKRFEGKFEITVVSDSILITVPNPKKAGGFFFFCNDIMFDLLLEGLPARGAIAWGEFYIKLKNGDVVKWQSYDDKTQMFEFELPNGKRSQVHQRDIEIC